TNYKHSPENQIDFVAKADSLICKYNKQNKCIKETQYVDLTRHTIDQSFDAIMPFERSTRFEYDEKGNVILLQDSSVNSIVPDWHWTIMETKCSYDNKGNPIEKTITDAPSQLNFMDTYTYNTRGELIECNTISGTGTFMAKSEYIYTYQE
ncbi:MAG: hypothetical protein ACRCYO_09300, partial [Bacteroidia bacterium]